jgi:hypothetical protein
MRCHCTVHCHCDYHLWGCSAWQIRIPTLLGIRVLYHTWSQRWWANDMHCGWCVLPQGGTLQR